MSATPSPRRERDPLVVLALTALVLYGSGSGIFTLLAELQRKGGFDDFGLGLVAFAFFGMALVVQLTLARLADDGAGRSMLVAGVAAGIASLVWFAFADSLTQMVLARALGGLGLGLFSPAAQAAVCAGHGVDAGKRLGVLTSAQTGGLILGPLVAAAAFQFTHSLSFPFLLFACLVGCSIPFLAVAPLAEPAPTAGAGRPSPWRLLRRARVRRAVLVVVALQAPVGMYEVVWAPLMDDLGASTLLIGLSLALYGIPFLIAAPIGGALGDRHGAERVSMLGGMAAVCVIAVMGIAPAVSALLVLGTLEAVCNATAIPNSFAAVSRAANVSEQATGQGLAGGLSLLCISVMTLLSGAVYDAYGQRGAFWFAAGLTAAILAAARATRVPDDSAHAVARGARRPPAARSNGSRIP